MIVFLPRPEPTVDELWLVFGAVHDYPCSRTDICDESGVHPNDMDLLLHELRRRGLIEAHSPRHDEWRLSHES